MGPYVNLFGDEHCPVELETVLLLPRKRRGYGFKKHRYCQCVTSHLISWCFCCNPDDCVVHVLKMHTRFFTDFQAFLITGGVYLLNRILDKEDKFNNLPRWMFFNKTLPRTMFWFLLAGSAIFGPVLLNVVSNRINVAIWFGVLSVIGIFYSVKLIPILMYKKGLQWISIKDIPIVESFVVCITWGGSGLILASAVTNVSVFRPDVLIIILTFVICNLNSTVTSDARDITGDKLRKIYTIPVLLEKGTLIFLIMRKCFGNCGFGCFRFFWFDSRQSFDFAALSVLWAGVSILPQFIAK